MGRNFCTFKITVKIKLKLFLEILKKIEIFLKLNLNFIKLTNLKQISLLIRIFISKTSDVQKCAKNQFDIYVQKNYIKLIFLN